MSKRRSVRVVLVIGFIVLLVDGAAAIWLGQIMGRGVLIGVGVTLLLAAAGLVVAYRRWMEALDAVDEAKRELKVEIERLREAADAARPDRRRN